jgi:hypothetical protein
LKSNIGAKILNREAFTFLLNTDGISICEKSGLTIWPILLAINEIAIGDRFCIDNIIIAGNYKYFCCFFYLK